MRKPTAPSIDGLLLVDKPLGWSSMDVVRAVRRAAGGVKTGHAGTLDPLATGVVVCCLGRAAKSVEQLMGLTKVYETTIDLSAFTSTDDREGLRLEVPCDRPAEATVREAVQRFVGWTSQRPPTFSAVHVQGRRAYQLARKGQSFELPEKQVRIDAVELLGYAWPNLELRITCGRGTYIRSVARDLGGLLRTGGHLAALRRTRVGQYDQSQCVTQARLTQPISQADLLPIPPAGV